MVWGRRRCLKDQFGSQVKKDWKDLWTFSAVQPQETCWIRQIAWTLWEPLDITHFLGSQQLVLLGLTNKPRSHLRPSSHLPWEYQGCHPTARLTSYMPAFFGYSKVKRHVLGHGIWQPTQLKKGPGDKTPARQILIKKKQNLGNSRGDKIFFTMNHSQVQFFLRPLRRSPTCCADTSAKHYAESLQFITK